MIGVLLFSSLALGANLSLLQEAYEIECTVKRGDSKIQSLWIEKRDYLLKITGKDKVVEEFDQVKFLDRGVLAKSKTNGEKLIFFQIFRDGVTKLHQGRIISFKEKDCEDTGASKLCKSPELGELKWTPEKLALTHKKERINVDISAYDFFPSKATFAFGQESRKSKEGYPSLLLIDYGANVDLFAGHSSEMTCEYKKD